MRIRKRQVPFPLSQVTLSDPHLINRSPVVVQLNDATTITPPKPSCTHGSATAPIPTLDPSQPSDQPLPPIGKPTNGCDDSSGHRRQHKKQECLVEDGDGRGQEGGGGQKGNDSRKGGILGSNIPSELFSPSSPSKQDGRWCEGERAIPLKKRRGSMESVTQNSNNVNNNKKKKKKKKKMMKARMKTKMNKKYISSQDDSTEGEEEVRETKPDVNVSKKRVRGGALMEGSRCSRVNGRGWRCCQQTLVGYSLCEHHLGKGRLRSMTSVRSRSIATNSAPKNVHELPLSGASSSSPEKQTKSVTDPLGNGGEDNDEKKPLMSTKKRMKLGMVKARSMSNLLGQTNTEIGVTQNNK